MTERVDVAIVGAGIGGLAAGVALRRAGLSIRIYERARELREVGAGISLWSNAVLCLREIGREADVLRASSVLVHATMKDERGRVISQAPMTRVSERTGAACIALHRHELILALRAGLDARDLELGRTFVRSAERADGVELEFEDGTRSTARVLVAADGIDSRARAQLLDDGPPRYAGYSCWRGVTRFDAPEIRRGAATEMWGSGRRFGIVPIGHGLTYWFAPAKRAAGERAPDERSAVLEAFAGWAPPVEALVRSTPAADVLRHDIFDRAPRPWGARGRITLLGDAAHPSTPNLGQGACMAIEDAVVLARSIRALGPSAEALRSYEKARIARTNLVVARSHRLGRLGMLEGPLLTGLRNTLMRATPGFLTRGLFESIARTGPAARP